LQLYQVDLAEKSLELFAQLVRAFEDHNGGTVLLLDVFFDVTFD
jgi:hypothetical protein